MRFKRQAIWGFAAVVLTMASAQFPALAFTDAEVEEVFKTFDEDHDGKVTRTEFNVNKVQIIYRDIKTDPIRGVTFEQTRVSRQYFDSLDDDHDGKLSPTEILDGLRFENVRSGTSEYFTLDDLRRFMTKIGR